MTESASTLVMGDCLSKEGNPEPNTLQLRFFFSTYAALNKARFILVTMNPFTGVKDSDITSASTISKLRESLSAPALI